MIRVAIFASGTGTNALNLLRTAKNLKQLQIPLVIIDQTKSTLPDVLKKEFPEVTVAIVLAPKIQDVEERRRQHEKEIVALLTQHQIDWCFLAGYMRLLGPTLLSAFKEGTQSRIVNIHPSLLPLYPGTQAYEKVFEANDPKSGVTIHFVDEGMDTGPIIVQEVFERKLDETFEQFKERGLKLEWQTYAAILKRLHDEQTLKPRSESETRKT